MRGTPYTGTHLFHEKILQKLNPTRNIKNAYVAIEDMVDYDLVNLKAKVNTESLAHLKFLQEDEKNIYIEDLAIFTKWIMTSKQQTSKTKIDGSRAQAIEDEFEFLLSDFFQLRHSNQGRVIVSNAVNVDNLKVTLMKLKLLLESMPEARRTEIDRQAQRMKYADFQDLLLNIKETLDQESITHKPKIDEKIDQSWIGTRYGLEIPNTKDGSEVSTKKDLGVELLNRNFMW